MQVILLERVAKLGQMGEVVEVKPGFARNYLLPQGKALSASAQNIADFEARKAQYEAQNLETRKEAEAMADKLHGQQFIVIRQASDSGALYGSVSTRDASDAATENGFSLERKQVALTRPIKELGLHDVIVTLHPEVEATIQLNVARSNEEAELQASGKSIRTQLPKPKRPPITKSRNSSRISARPLPKMMTSLKWPSPSRVTTAPTDSGAPPTANAARATARRFLVSRAVFHMKRFAVSTPSQSGTRSLMLMNLRISNYTGPQAMQ